MTFRCGHKNASHSLRKFHLIRSRFSDLSLLFSDFSDRNERERARQPTKENEKISRMAQLT